MLLKKLVIAEDDDAIAHLVAACLGDAGFLCLRARDGEETLTLVRRELPDLLVLDVMMPKMDGIEVCKLLKEDVILSRIPVLMLTSLAGVDDRVAGLNSGADDYLPKPFDLRELAARIKALIRQSRRERGRNPITNLPGNEAIEERVTELLRSKKEFTLLYCDIENFRSYADCYGYRKAEDVIKKVGELMLEQCRVVSETPLFLGHLGGDDFIVVGTKQAADVLCEQLPIIFAKAITSFYSSEDIQRGHIVLIDPQGETTRRANFMDMSIARVDVVGGQHKTTEELANEVTRIKAASRKLEHIP